MINLSPDKKRVLEEIFRVLKPGGELHFADIFADRRLPEAWRVEGDRSRHFGLFDCGPQGATPPEGDSVGGCC